MMAGLIPFNNRKNRSVVSASPWNPFNMIDDFFNESPLLSRNLVSDPFKVDVKEMDNEYLVEAEVPGMKKEDIDLSLNDGRLSIAVNRKQEVETNDNDDSYIHRERRYDAMQRTLYLVDVKSDEVSAKLEDGLLKVTVSKDEKQPDNNSKRIEIE